MEIQTEEDMIEFCQKAKGFFDIKIYNFFGTNMTREWEEHNRRFISEGIIARGSHLQQGIACKRIHYDGENHQERPIVIFEEAPALYPSQKLLESHPDLFPQIPLTGNLSNCYDPKTKTFLFHMRGTNIAAPFGFQAAAAGMGRFREHPYATAKKELAEEAGIIYPISLFERKAIDVLPFMKAGKIPQPLFSFGFANDLSGFPKCNSLEDIARFEEQIKECLSDGTAKKREAYHFTLPYALVETITGELHDRGRFYCPIYQSTINFVRALRDSENL